MDKAVIVMFFCSDHTACSSTPQRRDKLFISINIKLLLPFSLHVGGSVVSKNIHKPGFINLPVYDFCSNANIAQQPGQLTFCIRKIGLFFDDELAKGSNFCHITGIWLVYFSVILSTQKYTYTGVKKRN